LLALPGTGFRHQPGEQPCFQPASRMVAENLTDFRPNWPATAHPTGKRRSRVAGRTQTWLPWLEERTM
jgi:hypothetical protein